MDVGAAFVTDAPVSELVQPRDRAFDDPAEAALPWRTAPMMLKFS